MQIRSSKLALAAIVVACAGVAAYWYWSPYLALRSMQSAAIARDATAFNAHVDYPRVRASLKAQLGARIGGADVANNPLAALGAMLGRTMSDKVVDAMVQPETIMRVMQHGQFGPTIQASAPDAEDTSAKPKWIILREGSDRLIATPESSTGVPEKQVKIVFERSGFAHWNLTDVRMPAV